MDRYIIKRVCGDSGEKLSAIANQMDAQGYDLTIMEPHSNAGGHFIYLTFKRRDD